MDDESRERKRAAEASTAQEVIGIVSSAEAATPSLATGIRRPAVEGDLDEIVLKAMRKAARERYASVAEFSADIGRHLEGLPVIARRGAALPRQRIARVDLGGQNKIAFREAVDLVGPDFRFDLAP